MILYTNYVQGREIIFIVPPIVEEQSDESSIFERFNTRMTTGMYRYFPRSFVLSCEEITVYDPSTEQSFMLKNRRIPIDRCWKHGIITERLNKSFELATFYNGIPFTPDGDKTDFKVITINPRSFENLEDYLGALDEIYSFF